MATVYAGHYTDPVQSSSGRSVPNATFQLYKVGTKVAPIYYTDRTKGTIVSSDPSSDARGNVDIWPEPGIYEYWYNGTFIQFVTVDQDDDEDDAAIAALLASVTATLGSYYTKAEVDAAITAGGGPTVGAELLAHKDQPNGYPSLTAGGLVPNSELPTTATTSTRTPSTHGATHDADGTDPIDNLAKYLGFYQVQQSSSTNAVEGRLYVCNMSIGNVTITLPTPSGANAKPIAVKRSGAANTLNITGLIDAVPGAVVPVPVDGMCIWLVPDVANTGWILFSNYIPLTSVARLDADNNFGDHINYNYRDNHVAWGSATLVVGTDIPWGSSVQLSNSGGCTVTLPINGKPGDWIVIGQGSAGQDTVAVAGGGTAFLVEPDSYFKTAKQNAKLLVVCIVGTGINAGYLISGYTGP